MIRRCVHSRRPCTCAEIGEGGPFIPYHHVSHISCDTLYITRADYMLRVPSKLCSLRGGFPLFSWLNNARHGSRTFYLDHRETYSHQQCVLENRRAIGEVAVMVPSRDSFQLDALHSSPIPPPYCTDGSDRLRDESARLYPQGCTQNYGSRSTLTTAPSKRSRNHRINIALLILVFPWLHHPHAN